MNGNRHLSSKRLDSSTPRNDRFVHDTTSVGVAEVRCHDIIPDDVADEIVAELREIENVAHE